MSGDGVVVGDAQLTLSDGGKNLGKKRSPRRGGYTDNHQVYPSVARGKKWRKSLELLVREMKVAMRWEMMEID